MKFLSLFIAALGTTYSFKNAAPKEGEEMSTEFEAELNELIPKLQLANPADIAKLSLLEGFASKLKKVNDKGELVDFSVTADLTDFSVISNAEVTRVYAEAGKVADLTVAAAYGTAQLAAQREEILRQYNLTVSGAPDPAIVELINTAKPEALVGLAQTYGAVLLQNFSPTCTKCKSGEHIEMRKSVPDETNKKDEAPAVKALSTDDYRREYSHKPLFSK